MPDIDQAKDLDDAIYLFSATDDPRANAASLAIIAGIVDLASARNCVGGWPSRSTTCSPKFRP